MITTNIRKSISVLALSLAFSAAAFAQAGTSAVVPSTGPSPTKVGVINIQAVMFNSNEGRRDMEALQKRFEPKQSELKSLNDEVENLKKQLAAQQDKLNDDERNNRVRAIEQKQKSLQRSLDDAKAEFDAAQGDLFNRLFAKMADVMDKYAKANGLAVIIDVSSQQTPVLWAAEQVNISPQVLEAYNAASGVAAPAVSAPSATRPATPRPATPAAKKPTTPGTTPK
ncbi:MAG: outer rane chaperone Skp (OmpH) [Acidobacteriales bacterium]|nr:outer rane chaperone Skp (OmpH) [Terriglobales bacterium]